MSEQLSFASETYLRAKSVWKGQTYRPKRNRAAPGRGSLPYSKGRDPLALGDILSVMTDELGWSEQLSQSQVITEWAELVGPDIAQHTVVISIEREILHVKCDSTAWATQLRRMRHQIVTKIGEQYPDAHIDDISFHGPHTPSWRHGPRSVPGRGPRDTYG